MLATKPKAEVNWSRWHVIFIDGQDRNGLGKNETSRSRLYQNSLTTQQADQQHCWLLLSSLLFLTNVIVVMGPRKLSTQRVGKTQTKLAKGFVIAKRMWKTR